MDSVTIRGEYKKSFPLANLTWFKVGGPAEILFVPADLDDLSMFLKQEDKSNVVVLGMGSNLLVRDGGIKGVVIKLSRGFQEIKFDGNFVTVGCGMSNYNFTSILREKGLSGLEFLFGIPGSVGGAIAMNAGCYGSEITNFLVSVDGVDLVSGDIQAFMGKELNLGYRSNALTGKFIFTSATFRLNSEVDSAKIKDRMNDISDMRATSQPIKERTGGSTFKNPAGPYKAWQLIDMSGFRGYKHGGAKVSEKHPNFLINEGNATANDLETLGELIVEGVKNKFGVQLEWEIKRIGERIYG